MRKILIILAVASLLLLPMCLRRRSSTAEDLQLAAITQNKAIDVFGQLRRQNHTVSGAYWQAVAQGLQKLETLDGAAYNEEYGVLTLHGRPAKTVGPYHLDDLMVALRSTYFEPQALGMTIDPKPEDPQGPEMTVRYFGGCEDTAFGWVLFECDRLLKSLSNGRDTLTGNPLAPAIPGFLNVLQLGLELASNVDPEWNRFWLTTDFTEGPSWYDNPSRSNQYQPILFGTEDGSAVSFGRCRLYLRTEVMFWRNGQLLSASAAKSKVADRFAGHFSDRFADFARLYPEFARAEALARLVILAEWIEKSGIPIDTGFIDSYRPEVSVRTPRVTPSVNASLTRERRSAYGSVTRMLKSFGGVDFKPRTFYADDPQRTAERERGLSQTVRQHPSQASWIARDDRGDSQIVAIPTLRMQMQEAGPIARQSLEFRRPTRRDEMPQGDVLPSPRLAVDERAESVSRAPMQLAKLDKLRLEKIRGPPVEQSHFERIAVDDRTETVTRAKLGFGSSKQSISAYSLREPENRGSGELHIPPPAVIERPIHEYSNPRAPPKEGFRAESDRKEAVHRVRSTRLNRKPEAYLGMPVFRSGDQAATLNLPRLIGRSNARVERTMGIEGVPGSEVRVIDHLELLSELGDIHITFGAPEIDQARRLIFYPPVNPNSVVSGYYPLARLILLRDGTEITFDESGFPVIASIPEQDQDSRTEITFKYEERNGSRSKQSTECRVRTGGNRAVSGIYKLIQQDSRRNQKSG